MRGIRRAQRSRAQAKSDRPRYAWRQMRQVFAEPSCRVRTLIGTASPVVAVSAGICGDVSMMSIASGPAAGRAGLAAASRRRG